MEHALDPYASGVLKPPIHDRLVADLKSISQRANVQPGYVTSSLQGVVSPHVIDWVKGFKKHGINEDYGLALVGPSLAKGTNTTCAVAGALIRNFIDARVFTVGQVIDRIKEGPLDPTCLLIPNFYVGKSMGASEADWRISLLQDFLWDRMMSGRQTVIYVRDPKSMGAEYGTSVSSLVETHYRTLEVV